MSETEKWLTIGDADGEEQEVSNDVIQLLAVATFNGLCLIIAALGQQGLLGVSRIEELHREIGAPLDHESCRDDSFLTTIRERVEGELADAMKLARNDLQLDDER